MGYVLVGLLFVVILAIGVTLLRASATRHGRRPGRASGDQSYGAGLPGSDTAILAPDERSPLGDTSEHAGRHQDGETVSDPDDRSGERGEAGATGDPHVARPVVGGEGEGRRRISP
jgi:hypothetical protein